MLWAAPQRMCLSRSRPAWHSAHLIEMAQEVETRLEGLKKPIRVAVMGCAVNGPGEAREADFGIAGGKGTGLLFRKGKVIRSVPES